MTGGSGFLGGRVVAELVAAGQQVTALVRSSSRTDALESLGAQLVVGSLDPPANLAAALDGVDAVAHCAGGGRARSAAEILANNRDTTRHLLEAARIHRPGLGRFVLVSSLAAHGPSPDGLPRSPDQPCSPVSDYGRSKAAAEDLCRAQAADIPVAILRPPAIYGPGDTRFLPLFKAAARGFVALPFPDAPVSVVGVDDCARAITALLTVDEAGSGRALRSGAAFGICEPRLRTWRELATSCTDRPVRVARIPRAVLPLAGAAAELAAWLRRAPVTFGRDKVRDAAQPFWVTDAAALTAATGWVPREDFGEAASGMAAGYREAGLL